MSDSDFEFVSGTPEQAAVFVDLQRTLIKLYNEWPGDTAVAVYAAALGCVTAMIESQFKLHLGECEDCRGLYKDTVLNLADVARHNFEHYHALELDQALIDQHAAELLVKGFFDREKR